ncbi:hypothetical protein BT93_J0186 [Corymbia citriodora subsp. variegata]|nr:hypothetical protein BT93_J0186 [Corymbia citriodora subsp. variegata]
MFIIILQVGKFARAVEEEADDVPHGGSVTAPKVLADIVESVAGAIFKDVDSNVKQYEGIFRGLLEPIIGPEELEQQPQPIALLNELYQKQGKVFHIKPEKKGSTYEARAYVDGKVVASCSSEDKKSAKLRAARICLSQFAQREPVNRGFDGTLEIAEAKKKLHDLCVKKKWSKPKYETELADPSHGKEYVCTVVVVTGDHVRHSEMGEKRSRKKEAERCAAFQMYHALRQSNYLSLP